MSDTGHTVKSYAEEMQSLNDDLIKMGSLTESQLADAMEAVIKLDKESVDKIVQNDSKINALRAAIDNQIIIKTLHFFCVRLNCMSSI